MQKLEIYGLAVVAALLLTVGAFFVGEFKGKYEEQASAATKLEKANETKLNDYAGVVQTRADADARATQVSQALIAAYDQGLNNVHDKLAKLQPTVVKGADGCPGFTDTARLRFNAVELLPAGPADESAGAAVPGAVPAGALPAAR